MAAPTKQPGEVSALCVYTLDEVNNRLGLGATALRKARREGLVVRKVGRRGFVLGRDLIAWITKTAAPGSLPRQIAEDMALGAVDAELQDMRGSK